jgi:hypothetical protein
MLGDLIAPENAGRHDPALIRAEGLIRYDALVSALVEGAAVSGKEENLDGCEVTAPGWRRSVTAQHAERSDGEEALHFVNAMTIEAPVARIISSEVTRIAAHMMVAKTEAVTSTTPLVVGCFITFLSWAFC